MSAARKFTVAFALVIAALVVGATSSLAQMGGPSPSGGTCLRHTIEEGSGSAALANLSGGTFINLISLRGWLISLAPKRSMVTATSRPLADSRTLAVVQRRIWQP